MPRVRRAGGVRAASARGGRGGAPVPPQQLMELLPRLRRHGGLRHLPVVDVRVDAESGGEVGEVHGKGRRCRRRCNLPAEHHDFSAPHLA
eukprot:5480061-Alexandrium_andersonii.AAC.1